jgi:hypothetical protein
VRPDAADREAEPVDGLLWSGDALGLALADLIVARLLPAGAALTIAVDDTLFKRSGKKVFGAAWHHDGAAKGPKPIGFGNCWVVAGIIVQLPFLSPRVSQFSGAGRQSVGGAALPQV